MDNNEGFSSISHFMYMKYKVKALQERIELAKDHRDATLRDIHDLKISFISLWEDILDNNLTSTDPCDPPLDILCAVLSNLKDSFALIKDQ